MDPVKAAFIGLVGLVTCFMLWSMLIQLVTIVISLLFLLGAREAWQQLSSPEEARDSLWDAYHFIPALPILILTALCVPFSPSIMGIITGNVIRSAITLAFYTGVTYFSTLGIKRAISHPPAPAVALVAPLIQNSTPQQPQKMAQIETPVDNPAKTATLSQH